MDKIFVAAFVFIVIVAVPGTSSAFEQIASKSSLGRFAYEVSSIRPDRSGGGGMAYVSFGNERLEAEHVPLRLLIHLAYGVDDIQIRNMPKWVTSDSYTVEATVAPDTTEALSALPSSVRSAALRHMLQTLLAERFHLVVQEENEESSVYVLTVAPHGPKLQPANPTNQYENGSKFPDGMALGPHIVGYEFGEGSIRMISQGGTISQLSDRLNQSLSVHMQRIFVDETKIEGIYDFELDFSVPWVTEFGFIPPGREVPEAQGDSLFSAIQRQLGLKLVSAKRPIPVITVEQAEKPTEN